MRHKYNKLTANVMRRHFRYNRVRRAPRQRVARDPRLYVPRPRHGRI